VPFHSKTPQTFDEGGHASLEPDKTPLPQEDDGREPTLRPSDQPLSEHTDLDERHFDEGDRPLPEEDDRHWSGLRPDDQPLPEDAETAMPHLEDNSRPASLSPEASNQEKGKFGEDATCRDLLGKGATLIGRHEKPQGIDSVWERNGKYFVVESKFGSSVQSRIADGSKQGSAKWTLPRLAEAVGDLDKAQAISDQGYHVLIAHVDYTGGVHYEALDQGGDKIIGPAIVRPNAPASIWSEAEGERMRRKQENM
jgi:hypothetical protein